MTVGVISDTHGIIGPEAVEALRDSELIVHAGDVGRPEVLKQLGAIAPTIAVRGNIDRDAWAQSYPCRRSLKLAKSGSTCCTTYLISTSTPRPQNSPPSFRVTPIGRTPRFVAGSSF